MLQVLCAKLRKVGLLSLLLTKVFTTKEMNIPDVIIVNDEPIDVMKSNGAHKYLGRTYNGDLTKRRHIGFQHRVRLAWAKFNHYREALTNKQISIEVRLRLFDAVVTPTILFGLMTMPLTASDLNQLDTIQRRIRSLLGWVRVQDEPWRDMMSRNSYK